MAHRGGVVSSVTKKLQKIEASEVIGLPVVIGWRGRVHLIRFTSDVMLQNAGGSGG